eukprot:CAMPEP_0206022596 /NCGR_PEP_ID=MMETSP1464-20131121/34983_1 /ASSEMBLY_ACC=CAM_ASM_001124 /TAXON_ID=119497 /ORGANISM="Exanthemachrysis gayraliae, Strain RCC1523" /LENGTH=84 /DNA_ID=CAMNT_0053396565 /DNA_START=236 /DNA_END=491 /DNA_ORIENTATION=+
MSSGGGERRTAAVRCGRRRASGQSLVREYQPTRQAADARGYVARRPAIVRVIDWRVRPASPGAGAPAARPTLPIMAQRHTQRAL